MHRSPGLLTTSTNRNLFQPTKDNKARRRSEIRQSIHKGKNRSSSPSEGSSDRPAPGAIESKIKRDHSTASGKSQHSQLVDLVVEDTEAEEAELVRARKEGGDVWNKTQQKHFVRTYDIGDDAPEGQEIREGFEPTKVPARFPPPEHAVSDEEDDDEENGQGGKSSSNGIGRYDSLIEEDNVWDRS